MGKELWVKGDDYRTEYEKETFPQVTLTYHPMRRGPHDGFLHYDLKLPDQQATVLHEERDKEQ